MIDAADAKSFSVDANHPPAGKKLDLAVTRVTIEPRNIGTARPGTSGYRPATQRVHSASAGNRIQLDPLRR